MSGVVKCGGKASLAAVVATLMVMPYPVSAATFTPADVAGLVAAINTANTNGQSDTIDLGGRTFTLTAVDNTLNGPNGLPGILADGGSMVTIRDGMIERSLAAPAFRFLHVSLGATLALETTTLRAGSLDAGEFGGAVFNLGTLSIVGSTFSDNRAYPGQSGAIENDGTLSVASSVFSGNSSFFAGAIGNNGTLSITASTFSQNFAEVGGGAILNAGTTAAIRNSTFSANASARGGAVFNWGVIGAITNTTLSLNWGAFGGGVHNDVEAQILELTSSTVAQNMGGYSQDILNAGTIVSASDNVIGVGDGSGLTNGVDGNQVGSLAAPLDPILGPLADNGGPTFTHALLPGSPAIDAGSNPAALANDQRGPGFSRVSGAQADVGAFEVQSADLSVTKVDTPDPVVAGGNLTWTVTVSNAGPDAAATVALVDTLPSGTTFVSLAAPGGWSCSVPAVGTTGTVSCSTASMPVGSAAFTIVAAVDGATPLGTVLSNTATVTSVTPDPDSADTSVTATTTVGSPAVLSATKAVTGDFRPGRSVTYTLALRNAGLGLQLDNPGNELVDVLPAELALVSATATSGAVMATTGTNAVTWNGSIPAGGTVTISIQATVRATTPEGARVSNQATIAYDLDGNGTNEASTVSDDPATPAAGDATVFVALAAAVAVVPALDAVGVSLLALLVALGGVLVLGRRLL
ncbi:MAG TPA: DUF11 domain-containing protein [Thermoanaerobaculia bacterium]|nr:DUF11 domain-containing protein [Thermoanaerobaculia bacterium]